MTGTALVLYQAPPPPALPPRKAPRLVPYVGSPDWPDYHKSLRSPSLPCAILALPPPHPEPELEPELEPEPVERPSELERARRVGRESISPRIIAAAVADHFGISVRDLTGPSRKHPIVLKRFLGFYLCRVLTNGSWPAIARAFRRADHSTTMHGFRRHETLRLDSKVRADEAAVLELLGVSLWPREDAS